MAKKKQKFSGLADFLDEDQPGQIVVEFNRLDEKTKKAIELQDKLTDIPVADRPVAAFNVADSKPLSVDFVAQTKPVQDPYKTRVNPVQERLSEPVQDPYKTRVSEKQAFDKPVHQPVHDPVQDPYKTRVNPVQKSKNVQTLTGKQKVAFFYLLSDAKENGGTVENGDRITSQIPSAELARIAQTKGYEATRSVTNALKKASLVERYKSKDGPGGWTIYRIFKSVYVDGLNHLSRVNPPQDPYKTRVNPVHQPVHQPVQTSPSSSRNLLIKESTTTQPVDALSQIDLGLVQPFGITTSVLARCTELYPVLQPEQLEVLVFRFAEFAKDPKNRVQNARGFFISLAEQASKGQVPLDHIETPDERLMRSFIERQKEAKARRTDAERAAQEFECEAWLESLAPEMKLILVPETAILKAGTGAHAAMLKSHFAEKVWPERRKEILEREVSL